MKQDNLNHFKEIEEEFRRHLVDSNDSKRAHFDLADYYHERARVLDITQGFGLAVVLAWLLSSQFQGLLPDSNIIVQAMPTVLAILVSVLSTLKPILKYHEKALEHENCAKRYHTLWRTCKNWKTDFPDESFLNEAKIAVQRYRDQLNDINRDAPHLSSILWDKIERVRKRSQYEDVSKYSFEELKVAEA